MIKTVVIVALILGGLLISELFRRSNLKRMLAELDKRAKTPGGETEFLALADSVSAKLQFSRLQRLTIKLNYFIAWNRPERVRELHREVDSLSLSDSEAVALYRSLFSFYLTAREKRRADACAQQIRKRLAGRTDDMAKALLTDVDYAMALYLDHDAEKLAQIRQMAQSAPDRDVRAMHQYVLSKYYYYEQRFDESRELLQQAIDNSSRQSDKDRLQQLMDSQFKK